MSFAEELDRYLPQDLPHRNACVEKGAAHLERIVETNATQFNLTRIVDPHEAAIKHTVDSLLPWRLFAESGASRIVDAGSGPGFPGIPLAIAFPEIAFTLIESTQKKARFIEATAAALELPNVTVAPERAEDWFKSNRIPLFTARAVAPLERALPLFGPAIKNGARALLYKGPDADLEIALTKANPGFLLRVASRYELPDAMGIRTIVEIRYRR